MLTFRLRRTVRRWCLSLPVLLHWTLSQDQCTDLKKSPGPGVSSDPRIQWEKSPYDISASCKCADEGQVTLEACYLATCYHFIFPIGSNRVSPVDSSDPYSAQLSCSARLYRNLSGDVFSKLSAVFCSCLSHPVYTEVT